MSIERLQRYLLSEDFDEVPTEYEESGVYCLTKDVTEIEATNAELVKALEDLLDRYRGLVNCGDCGHWDPEKEDDVIAARKALASAKGDNHESV